MRTTSILALATLSIALAAAPASAAKRDDGPYTPFPEGDPQQRAVEFVRKLNAERIRGPAARRARGITAKRLAEGRSFLDTGTTPRAEKAQPEPTFRRAGVSEADDGPRAPVLPFALLAGALGLAAIGFELRARRRRPVGA